MPKCVNLFLSPEAHYRPRFVKPEYISTSSTLLFTAAITQMTWVIFRVVFLEIFTFFDFGRLQGEKGNQSSTKRADFGYLSSL